MVSKDLMVERADKVGVVRIRDKWGVGGIGSVNVIGAIKGI